MLVSRDNGDHQETDAALSAGILMDFDYCEKYLRNIQLFHKQHFFQLNLSVALLFHELSLKCCLSVC